MLLLSVGQLLFPFSLKHTRHHLPRPPAHTAAQTAPGRRGDQPAHGRKRGLRRFRRRGGLCGGIRRHGAGAGTSLCVFDRVKGGGCVCLSTSVVCWVACIRSNRPFLVHTHPHTHTNDHPNDNPPVLIPIPHALTSQNSLTHNPTRWRAPSRRRPCSPRPTTSRSRTTSSSAAAALRTAPSKVRVDLC